MPVSCNQYPVTVSRDNVCYLNDGRFTIFNQQYGLTMALCSKVWRCGCGGGFYFGRCRYSVHITALRDCDRQLERKGRTLPQNTLNIDMPLEVGGVFLGDGQTKTGATEFS